jgi:hypothetical protein
LRGLLAIPDIEKSRLEADHPSRANGKIATKRSPPLVVSPLKSAVGRTAEVLAGWAPLDRHLPSAIPLAAGLIRF